MKQSIYKITIFFLLIGLSTVSQTKKIILNKNFKADETTILTVDIENVAIIFEESSDNSIYFDYSILFGKYSKRAIEKRLNQIEAKVLKNKNKIDLTVRKSTNLQFNHVQYYRTDSLQLLNLENYITHVLTAKENYKTRVEVLEELYKSNGSNLNETRDLNLNNKFLKHKSFIEIFRIKVPKDIKIRVKSKYSDLTFRHSIITPFSLNSFKGTLKFKGVLSKQNRIIASNGFFQAEKIANASVEFLDMSKVVIADISNTDFATETSKIEIGEVGENININDFNSKLYFYNFSNSFETFNFKGDYSKINFYNVKDEDYNMNVFGHNTALNMLNTKTTFGISKVKKLENMVEKKVKEGKISKGNIAIELVNGILNFK